MNMKIAVAIFLTAVSASAAPTIGSIDPASGPASGGTFVHITGTDLIGLPLACPALACGNYVQFGEILAPIAMNTSTEIVVIAPAHGEGSVDLTINIAGKQRFTIPNAFRYEAPAITDVEPILLPLIGQLAGGAFGSIWKTEITLHNAADEDLTIVAPTCDPLPAVPCPVLRLPAASTTVTSLFTAAESNGGFVYVPRAHVDDVDISIRVQDISRGSQTWGTSIPVIRAGAFRRKVRLNGVPANPRFRVALRIYGYAMSADPITVRLFDPASSSPLAEASLTLHRASTPYPAYLQINSVTDAFPQIGTHDPVRIEVESASTPATPIWALVSVTSNETQQVSIIEPSPAASP